MRIDGQWVIYIVPVGTGCGGEGRQKEKKKNHAFNSKPEKKGTGAFSPNTTAANQTPAEGAEKGPVAFFPTTGG